MRRQTEGWRLWMAVGIVVAFILLSGGLRHFALAPGLRISTEISDTIDEAFASQERRPNPLGGEAVGVVISVVAGLSVMLFVVAILRKESRLSMLAAVLVGAALAVLLAGIVRPSDDDAPIDFGAALGDNTESAVGAIDLLDREDAVDEYPEKEPVPWFWSIVIVLTGIGGVLVVVRSSLRKGSLSPDGELGEVAAGAANEIEAGVPLHDVIQRCYRDMVTAVQESRSLRRSESMTPREFESRLLREGVSADDVRGLTRLFERSRYSGGRAAGGDEALAVEYLRNIARTLEGKND